MQRVDNFSNLKLLEIINRLDFFRQFSIEDRKVLLEDRIEVYVCNQDFNVFREGEVDSTFYLLLAGKVKIIQKSGNRKLGSIGPGEFLGEGAFVTRAPRTASAVAEVKSILLRIDSKALSSMSSSIREKLKDAIIAGLGLRINQLNERLKTLE
ncbi:MULTISPECIES: cyclic nucleotide-binding domain-containing protein [Gammaproteobacteria]|uniref:cyclic nucleotide-binding domain-containing protein n=1 Tax=Gammaproteobacteria TaxID=1236 RepID=UPI000DD01A26|nr:MULTISPECIES: cyclic nucleotide-binding domain-containing protein [Gammaproteobacteria]RTE85604.1 cyclic nucleotide-binding domain-containing protein [Aliidiomarina sp. B3213]TCZ89573.1 cyclic nucleotide-binding domain-containing protein [Lysobacter sp. N42]